MFKNRKYPSILQLPFCCVPATLQKVLYRHGLDILDQEYIGAELGLRLPLKGKLFFSQREITYLKEAPRGGFGTQIEKQAYSINAFFRSNKIPLRISRMHRFASAPEFERFLVTHLRQGHDVVLRYNNAIFKGKDQKGYGHLSLITSYSAAKSRVELSDTEQPFTKRATVRQLLLAMSETFDGIKRGVYIIEPVQAHEGSGKSYR